MKKLLLINFVIMFPFVETFSATRVLSFQTSDTSQSASSSEVINIENNETVSIIASKFWYEATNRGSGGMALQLKNGSSWVDLLGKENIKPDQTITLEGPCQIRLHGGSQYYNTGSPASSYYWVAMNIFYNINPKVSEDTPQKFATVIPENSSGNVDIILEQSTDLINWSAVNPGSFPPSTAKRFFRVRSQE